MKAIVMERYGTPDVLELTDVPTPTPKADEVLVVLADVPDAMRLFGAAKHQGKIIVTVA